MSDHYTYVCEACGEEFHSEHDDLAGQFHMTDVSACGPLKLVLIEVDLNGEDIQE